MTCFGASNKPWLEPMLFKYYGAMHDNVTKWLIFRVTVPLCGEFAGHRWIPLTKANYAELCCLQITQSFDACFDLRLNKQLSKQSRSRWSETSSRSVWRHCNVWHYGEDFNYFVSSLNYTTFMSFRMSSLNPASLNPTGCNDRVTMRRCAWNRTI